MTFSPRTSINKTMTQELDFLEKQKQKVFTVLTNQSITITEYLQDKINKSENTEELRNLLQEQLEKKNQEPVIIKPADDTTNKSSVQILDSYEEFIKKREMSDFVKHYTHRFDAIAKMLKSRDIKNLTAIRRILDLKDKEQVGTIAMVFDVGETKNGHFVFTLEDKTGIIKGIVMKDKKELIDVAKNILCDEVIAVTGTAGKDVIFIDDIILPDIPMGKELKCSPVEEYAVFTGDLEFGAKSFYSKEFDRFLEWICGTNVPAQHKEMVSKIKYLIIPGDTIYGVGIYPGQEHELVYPSAKEQYEELTKYLSKIPKHIQIIICPGNHDALRLAEPQPPFDRKYAASLMDMPNVTLVSSPGTVNIGKTNSFEGFNVLFYHGFSMPQVADKVPEIRAAGGLNNPENVLRYYLQRRHFAPMHGLTQFVPDIRYDPLTIVKVPDFLVTGHIHKISVSNYRGVTMMNTSAWTAPTEYQSRFGLKPDNCRAIIVNLKNREFQVLNFMAEREKKAKAEKEAKEAKAEEVKEKEESN